MNLVLYRSFSGNHREIRKVLKWKTAVFFTFPMRRRKKRLNFSGKPGFQSGIISPVFRKYEIKSKVLCPRQVRQKRRNPLYRAIPRHSSYSNSIMGLCFLLYVVVAYTLKCHIYTDYTHSTTFLTFLRPFFAHGPALIGDCLAGWKAVIYNKGACTRLVFFPYAFGMYG